MQIRNRRANLLESEVQTEPDERLLRLTTKVQKLNGMLHSESEANEELTEQLEEINQAHFKTRQELISVKEQLYKVQKQLQEKEDEINNLREEQAQNDSKGCETCIDYIKILKRTENEVKQSKSRTAQLETDKNKLLDEIQLMLNRDQEKNRKLAELQMKVKDLEDEAFDRVNESLSYSQREYEYIR